MSDYTTLYRLYADDGTLLYVGIAGNPGRRFEQHAKDKPWWSDVANIDLEHHDSRLAAAAAERQAIIDEKPVHNIVHRVREPAPPGLVIRCHACTEPIADGDGWLEVDRGDIARIREKRRPLDAKQMLTGGELLAYVDTAHWHAWHRDCDPDPSSNSYWIQVQDVRTWRGVVHETAHLMQKRWLELTDWHDVLARLAWSTGGQSGGPIACDDQKGAVA